MASFRIVIHEQRCKSCQYCIKFCPKNVFEVGKNVNAKGYEYIDPVRMEDCIGCQSCTRICPDGAIEMYKEV